MQFRDWGEDHFVQYLAKHFPSKEFIVGIGDDCAVIPGEQGMAWLITTDALVEGIHFLKDQIPAIDLGHKTVAVGVSDIVAMGGEPKYAFLSIALPKTVDRTWVCEVIQGIKEACEKWNLLLLGGDTVGSKGDIFFNITLIGSAVASKIKYRHQASLGDVICVSEYLGDSGGGCKALQNQIPKNQDVHHLLHAHFHPNPKPEQGLWLAAQNNVHAMMDISDGLDCDLKRLIKSSQCGAIIDMDKIPISASLARVSLSNEWDVFEVALTGGEDYCLLLTVAADAFDLVQHSFQEKFGSPLYDIGHIISHPKELIYQKCGETVQTNYKIFDHFQ